MKPKLFLSLMLFIFIGINAQDYKPLVRDNYCWSVLSGGYAAFSVSSGSTLHYKVSGDTLIYSRYYKKLLSSQDSLKQSWTIIGFLREDEFLKKVWFLDTNKRERLLYDFNISLGTEVTLNNFFNSNELNTYTVTNVDSVLISNEYRKRYTLSINNNWKEYWIEGVGSLFGLTNTNIYGLCGGFRELLCFSDMNIDYVNPKHNTCWKNRFTPKIIKHCPNDAIVNQYYHSKIETSEIFKSDSILYYLIGGTGLPQSLMFSMETGEISGIPTESGNYNFIILVENKGYITDYFETELKVDAGTNIHSEREGKVKAYLHVNEDKLMIESSINLSGCFLSFTNMDGRQVLKESLGEFQNSIDLKRISKGIYIVSIINDLSNEKLLLEKMVRL